MCRADEPSYVRPLGIYGIKWAPSTDLDSSNARRPCAPWPLQVYELDGTELKLLKDAEHGLGFKCGTLGASSVSDTQVATGSFSGQLQLWDLENAKQPIFSVQAHASIVNGMDGFGGKVKMGLGWAGLGCFIRTTLEEILM